MHKDYSDGRTVKVDSKSIELFMHKSPNWITMGKAFSLKYDIQNRKFNYELDSVNLEKSIKNQEKLLFSKIVFNKKLLPNEFMIISENIKSNEVEEKKQGFFKKLCNKILNIFKNK